MKFLQFRTDTGKLRGGVIRGPRVQFLSAPVLNLVRLADKSGLPVEALLDLTSPGEHSMQFADIEHQGRLTAPILPPEVWGAGVTYRRSAEFRDADMQGGSEGGSGIYDRIYTAERPELFFKATASRVVGPGDPIGLREDATFTAPEPELAVVLGPEGRIVAYTLGNDVSAWSIERENPLYLPQSKIYRGCCALGPLLVTADEIPDPRALELRCRVLRDGEVRFEGAASVAQMKWSIPDLVDWLLRCNDVPEGSVLLTGTGIIVPPDAALAPGDVVEISCDGIGTLRNPCEIVPARRRLPAEG